MSKVFGKLLFFMGLNICCFVYAADPPNDPLAQALIAKAKKFLIQTANHKCEEALKETVATFSAHGARQRYIEECKNAKVMPESISFVRISKVVDDKEETEIARVELTFGEREIAAVFFNLDSNSKVRGLLLGTAEHLQGLLSGVAVTGIARAKTKNK